MKKDEAEELAVQRVDLVMEYIEQILNDTKVVNSSMNFSTTKIDGNNMCTLDIFVPSKDFEKHLNLGITSDHKNVIYKELLDRISRTLFDHDTIGVSRFYSMRTSQGQFDGIDTFNIAGSVNKINMTGIDKSISDEYNKKIDDYTKNLNSGQRTL